MITNENIRTLYQNGEPLLAHAAGYNGPLQTQFFRGIATHRWPGQHPGGCQRHMAVFNGYDVIPEYCFNCFKVLIKPRTVMELFKLMVIMERQQLENDNTRKCMVEMRTYLSGPYKGFVYTKSLEEGLKLQEIYARELAQEVSPDIPVEFKRGCSEYGSKYPEYPDVSGGQTAMDYREDWREIEAEAEKRVSVAVPDATRDSFNSPGFTVLDALVMNTWLRYAAAIGDNSYLEISGQTLQPLPSVKPSPDFFSEHP